jgi:queuine tRNA-ribosyltransferase
MVLDECPPWPVTEEEAAGALERTLAWARRAREAWESSSGNSASEQRRSSASSRGATTATSGSGRRPSSPRSISTATPSAASRWASPRPRAGRPWNGRGAPPAGGQGPIPHGGGHSAGHPPRGRAGVDLFDCVLPARNARHGVLFTRSGPVKLKQRRATGTDPRPPDPDCALPHLPPGPGPSSPTSPAPARSPPKSSPRSTTSPSTLTSWPTSGKLAPPERWRSFRPPAPRRPAANPLRGKDT